MRRELIWALAASASLAGWALLNPVSKTENGSVVAPTERSPSPAGSELGGPSASTPNSVGFNAGQSPQPETAVALPTTWPAPNMAVAERSPFVAPTPPAPKPVAIAPLVAAPTPPQPPPAVTYRFWGSLTTPAGERVLYVARDDNAPPIAVQVGTRLDGGFHVEQITAAAIVLVQAETQQRVTLSLSPPRTAGAR